MAKVAQWAAPVRILVFLCILAMCWLPVAAPIALLVSDANTVTILTMSLLFAGFLLLIPIWGRAVHGESKMFRRYGLGFSWQNGRELLAGLFVGLISVFAVFGVQAGFGWLEWQTNPMLASIILAGGIVALGVGLAEELVFRGWILDELDRDYSPPVVLWSNSLLFAALHFLKPFSEMVRTFPQFPGLVLLGLALVWAKRSTCSIGSIKVNLRNDSVNFPAHLYGRLGLPIGLHAGLVWGYYIIQVGGLTQSTQQVSEWLTGIDGNPLAGAIGLFSLTLIALCFKRLTLEKN